VHRSNRCHGDRCRPSPDGKSTTFTKSDGSRYTLTSRIVSGGPPYTVKIYLRGKHISTVKTNADGSMRTYDARGRFVATGR
jgi:hypothetical protein